MAKVNVNSLTARTGRNRRNSRWLKNNPLARERKRKTDKQWRERNALKVALKRKSWNRENRDKVKAHVLVARAIKSGKLLTSPCQICGEVENVVAHHNDYNFPLTVLWLCARHHQAWHEIFIPERAQIAPVKILKMEVSNE